MEKNLRKKLYRICDPYKTPQDENININIDEFYEDSTLVRGYNWSERLYDKIDFGEGDTIQLFTGYSGSGKTTELKKVQKLLDKDDYLSVYINADDYIDITKELEISDIYNSIIYNVVIKVNELLGKKATFSDEGYFARLNNFLSSDVQLKQMKTSNFVLELKDTPTLRQKVLNEINDNFSTYKKMIREDLHKLNEKVKEKGKKGIVVIFDTLEKNKGISTNYKDVIKACELVFSNRDNLSLPLDVIYTVPAYLSERITTMDIDFLPVVKIKNKDEEYFSKGIDLLKKLVYKRVEEKYLKEILGTNYEDILEDIIKFSGGYVRGLLVILREIIIQKDYPVKVNIIEKIKHNEINRFQEFINNDLALDLASVKKDKKLVNIENTETKDRLLSNHLILRYSNKNTWFDIHPAIEGLLNSDK